LEELSRRSRARVSDAKKFLEEFNNAIDERKKEIAENENK